MLRYFIVKNVLKHGKVISVGLLGLLNIQTNAAYAIISVLCLVLDGTSVFHWLLYKLNSMCFISYMIPRLCSTFAMQSI